MTTIIGGVDASMHTGTAALEFGAAALEGFGAPPPYKVLPVIDPLHTGPVRVTPLPRPGAGASEAALAGAGREAMSPSGPAAGVAHLVVGGAHNHVHGWDVTSRAAVSIDGAHASRAPGIMPRLLERWGRDMSAGRRMRHLHAVALAVAVLLAPAPTASHAVGAEQAAVTGQQARQPGNWHEQPSQLGKFGRMYPGLTWYAEVADEHLAELAQSMRDPGGTDLDNPGVPAGFTYLGQFIDHDLTRDQAPQPSAPVDPTTLTNFRTARFDLDSVYGGGPQVDPQLYDGPRLRLQNPNPNGVPDLPRSADGRAIIGDNRNDENLIISQIHLAVISFHNRLVDEGATFEEARRLTRWHYQWVVVHDYLPHVAGQDRVDRFLRGTKVRSELYQPGSRTAPMTPVEFSAAVFRYGHSQVRTGYRLNDTTAALVFHPTLPDLRGGRHLPANLQIDWTLFFAVQGAPPFSGNLSRRIDTKISSALFDLPIPGAAPSGSNVLGFRNLVRGKYYGLPSGQSIANVMGIQPLDESALGLGPNFAAGAPLWYYALAESELREGGTRLGPVAGRIIAEVFLAQLAADRNSYLNAPIAWQPTVPHAGEFDFGEFLRYARVVDA